VWSSRQSLLAATFALLGGLAWWLLERQSAPEPPALQRQRSPDYVVSGFKAIETDETGRPSRQLVAKQLRQFVDEDLAELDRPNLTLFEADAPPWRASSRQGLLLAGGDEIRLSDAVRIERDASPGGRPVRLDTSELTVWPQRQYAQGDRPVRIESKRDWLTATGLRLWFAEPMRAEFTGRAHVLIAPEEPPPPTTEVTAP
jgi:lipopolysaccharide export system protein LptC